MLHKSLLLRGLLLILFLLYCLRYIQVGNAVAVPVAKALGCALSMAFQGSVGGDPTFTLPRKFKSALEQVSSESSENA